MATNNEWMNDPALKDMPRAKLEFLDKLFIQSTKINQGNQKEMLSFLLSLNKLSRDNNISFDKEEIELIFRVLETHSTPDEIAKMKKLSAMFHFQ